MRKHPSSSWTHTLNGFDPPPAPIESGSTEVTAPTAPTGELPEEPHDDQNEDDHQQHVNKIASLRNPWNSGGPEVPQKPKNDEDNHEKFEHERFLSMASARLTSVPVRYPNSTRSSPSRLEMTPKHQGRAQGRYLRAPRYHVYYSIVSKQRLHGSTMASLSRFFQVRPLRPIL